MPTLKEYFAPDAEQAVNVRAGEAGQESLVRAGRMTEEHARASGAIVAQGIGEIAHGVEAAGANVKKIIDDWTYSHDVVKQDAWLTGKQAEFTQKLQQAEKTWDPNDLDAPKRFLQENWAPLQEQYQAGFTNRRAAQRGEDLFRGATEHFQNVATSDFMDRAGAAKLSNLQQTGQNLEMLVGLDPSSTPQAHRQVDETVAGMIASNNVGPRYAAAAQEYARKQHQAIDQASLESMLVANPAGAEKLASGGFWKYLPAGATGQAIQRAQELHQMGALRGMEINQMQLHQQSLAALGDWQNATQVVLPNHTIGMSADAAQKYLLMRDKMQPAERERATYAISQGYNDAIKPFDHTDAVTSVQRLWLSNDPNADTMIGLLVATKQMTAETGAEWKALVNSPLAPQLHDPIVHGLYEDAMKAITQTIGAGNIGLMGQLTKPGDQALANTAILHVTQQLAGMDRAHIMEALDPSSPQSLVSAKALAIYMQQRSAFEQQYNGFNGQGGVSPTEPLKFGQ